jgi:hypothetical protein
MRLVQLLGSGSQAEVQQYAAGILEFLALDDFASVAAAGAIPLLVQLLEPGSPAGVQQTACAVLMRLVRNEEIAGAMLHAGAISPLVRLLGAGSTAGVQRNAAEALGKFALALARFCSLWNAHGNPSVAFADAIPSLVRLLDSPGVQMNALGALCVLSRNADFATIAAHGAHQLVQLLGPDASAKLQNQVMTVLDVLCENAADAAAAIAGAGAIPPLVQLLRAPGTQCNAAVILSKLSRNAEDAATIADADAIPLLVELLAPDCEAGTQLGAVAVLSYIARYDEIANAVAAAGAIPPLVQLLGPGARADVRKMAVCAVVHLARNETRADIAATITDAGAVQHLEQIVAGADPVASEAASRALMALSGVSPLVQLFGRLATGADTRGMFT